MKYLLILFLAFILISCDDNSIDNPPVKKVETELLGTWSGSVKQGTDSVYFTVSFADSQSGPVVNGKMHAKIITNNGTSTTNINQEGTVYYTYVKPSIVLRFVADSDYNGFVGILSGDSKTMIGEVQPYDYLFGKFSKYAITLSK